MLIVKQYLLNDMDSISFDLVSINYENDMSENATNTICKYQYSTLTWAAIDRNYKFKLIFINKSVNQESYNEILKKSKFF